MKKIITLLCVFGFAVPAVADTNIFFGDKINSLTLYVSQGTGSGSLLKLIQPGIWDFGPQTFIMAQYSQPMKFFRLDSRLNLNIGQNFGYKSSAGLHFFGIGISIDSALIKYDDWYLGIGIGPFMRDQIDRWVESRLVFQEKFFIGKNFADNWHLEFVTMHFSNGNFTTVNEGFNFFGVALGYKF